jgi:predicted peptidase
MRRRSLLQAVALAGFGRFAMAQSSAAAGGAAGAKGDQQRHYFFAAAGKDMPYRLYVPRSYDERVATPLIVALHGYGGNQDYFFEAVKELPALCEQYGVIFVAPMGLAKDGWYGAPLSIPGAAPRSGGGPTPTPDRTPEQETQYRALSEQDVLNVLDLVTREYKIDARRTYLMGHSMGGFGTWWLGQKYADRWAAIAPMSGVLPNVDYQLPKLKGVPVMVSIGGAETPAWVDASRKQIEAMKALGTTTAYFEPQGATHGGMIAPTTPRVFEFLAQQRKEH